MVKDAAITNALDSSRCLELDVFPEGDPTSSPGVAVLGYPGKDDE